MVSFSKIKGILKQYGKKISYKYKKENYTFSQNKEAFSNKAREVSIKEVKEEIITGGNSENLMSMGFC